MVESQKSINSNDVSSMKFHVEFIDSTRIFLDLLQSFEISGAKYSIL